MKKHSNSGQLPLFPEDQIPIKNDEKNKRINWSFSKRSTLEQCSRKYYYEYYGASKRNAKQEENKSELFLLKYLQNRYERTGAILHLVISHYLKKAQQGEVITLNRLEDWARILFNKDLEISTNYNEPTPPEGQYPPVILQELYYKIPDALKLCNEALDNVIQAFRNFYTSSRYANFREISQKPESLVEHPFKIKKRFFRIDGRIDFSYKDADKLVIIDWKSGSFDGGGEDSLQLSTYALWGVEHYSCLPEDIQVIKAFLRENELVEYSVDKKLLTIAEARISQDAERMVSLEKFGEEALVDAFTPCSQYAICKLCAYRRLCPEGRKVIYA
ncbi:MAG: PD-(D/E)XK nuclease family protein [Anaerolineales bacterium]|nr:PD-(D/E)XK nuclease family protein [Anaerolineales bacterium]